VNDYGSVRGGVKRGRLDSQRAVPFPGRGADGMQADEPPNVSETAQPTRMHLLAPNGGEWSV